MELQEWLDARPFTGPTVKVRAGLIGYMTDVERLALICPEVSLAEEGREVERTIGKSMGLASHAGIDAMAYELFGPARAYSLCEVPYQASLLTPEQVLKVLAMHGKAIYDKKLEGVFPLIDVDVSTALGAPVPVAPTNLGFVDQLQRDTTADEQFFDEKKMYTDNMEHKQYILEIKRAFLLDKYGLHVGCGPINEFTRPYDRTKSPQVYWDAVKPEGYKQKEGSTPVVWNCKGDVS